MLPGNSRRAGSLGIQMLILPRAQGTCVQYCKKTYKFHIDMLSLVYMYNNILFGLINHTHTAIHDYRHNTVLCILYPLIFCTLHVCVCLQVCIVCKYVRRYVHT